MATPFPKDKGRTHTENGILQMDVPPMWESAVPEFHYVIAPLQKATIQARQKSATALLSFFDQSLQRRCQPDVSDTNTAPQLRNRPQKKNLPNTF